MSGYETPHKCGCRKETLIYSVYRFKSWTGIAVKCFSEIQKTVLPTNIKREWCRNEGFNQVRHHTELYTDENETVRDTRIDLVFRYDYMSI